MGGGPQKNTLHIVYVNIFDINIKIINVYNLIATPRAEKLPDRPIPLPHHSSRPCPTNTNVICSTLHFYDSLAYRVWLHILTANHASTQSAGQAGTSRRRHTVARGSKPSLRELCLTLL